VNPHLLNFLACPRDHSALSVAGTQLRCANGHTYPSVDGIPVFLLPERDQTIGIASASLQVAKTGAGAPLYLDTIGVSERDQC
jgi:uncharacterized protein YbaR (Trm112 family)